MTTIEVDGHLFDVNSVMLERSRPPRGFDVMSIEAYGYCPFDPPHAHHDVRMISHDPDTIHEVQVCEINDILHNYTNFNQWKAVLEILAQRDHHDGPMDLSTYIDKYH